VEAKLTARQAVVGINPWVAHRNTEVFGRDAEDFVPERWDQEQTSQERLVAMEQYNLAFGAGSRSSASDMTLSFWVKASLIAIDGLSNQMDFLAESGEGSCSSFSRQYPFNHRVNRLLFRARTRALRCLIEAWLPSRMLRGLPRQE
jgi:hypothetical protein